MSETGFNDFHISSALQYRYTQQCIEQPPSLALKLTATDIPHFQCSVRELANKQKETDHLRGHVEVRCFALRAHESFLILPQALVRRLDAFAHLESSRILDLQKLKGDVRDIAGGSAFTALDHLDRHLAAAGGGLFPNISGSSAPESGRRGAQASVASKAKGTKGKKNG
jgi:hypothetical protein